MQKRIADGFDRWGRLMVRRSWLVIAIVLALSAGLGAQVAHLTIDNSLESYLHDDDPTLIGYNEFRDQFGSDAVAVIALEPREVFDIAFLEILRDMHHALENEVPHLDKVTSLVNARATRGKEDALVVEDLLETWPGSEAEVAAVRDRVFANPPYLDTLISRDGHVTTILVKPNAYSPVDPERDVSDDSARSERLYLTEEEVIVFVDSIRDIMARYQTPDVAMHLAGLGVVQSTLNVKTQADFGVFLAVSFVIIIVVLYTVFRRAAGVLLPLVTVVLSLLSTFGTMVLLGLPLSLVTEILPPFLLTVGVCDSVHILVIFFQRFSDTGDREEAIAGALSHSGLAVVMTSLTTAGGLVSFAWAVVAPVSHLGIVAPLGVILAMVFTLVLLPALLAVTPLRNMRSTDTPSNALLMRLVVAVGDTSVRRPVSTVSLWALIVALAALGLGELRFGNDDLRWFPEDEPVRVATTFIDSELNGAVALEVLIDTETPNGLYSPELLQKFERIAASAQSVRYGPLFVGKTMSVADVVKETHRALNENRHDYYAIPGNRQLVAQELLLFEMSGSDDLEELVDPQLSLARLSMKVPWADRMVYSEFLERLRHTITAIVGEDVNVEITGAGAVMARVASMVIMTMAQSYTLALMIITPLMILLLGSLKRGLLSMVPNLVPIFVILGVMGLLDIPIGMVTLVIGGIIIGLAVDDTIHFMHRFNRYYEDTGNAPQAVHKTLETTGTAMFFTSVVLTAGFLVFTLASMQNVATFGGLCALAATVAFLADVTLAPALMILATPARPQAAPAMTGALLFDLVSEPVSKGEK